MKWTLMENRQKFSKQILAGERFEVIDSINNIIREVPAKCIRQHFFAFSHLRLIIKKGNS